MYTVLVAENEPWVLKGIVEMVEAAGEEFEVVGACSNGEEAWSMIQEVWPMLLITDIMMPELDGLSLIKRVAEHRIPLGSIIISGYDNFQYAQQAITYGVAEYMLKPVEFGDLIESLNRCKEKLESVRGMNQYIVKFQNLLDNSRGMPPQWAMQKQEELIRSILRMNSMNKHARLNLLHIFEQKVKQLLKDFGIRFHDLPRGSFEDDAALVNYHKALLEKWYLEYPKSVKASIPIAIERSCQYIAEHLREEITLTEMAERSNFSVSHFSSLFKKHTGSSLVSYVNGLRVEEAKKLLLSSSYAVAEIADIVGFSTTPYFTRTFKAAVGVSPLEYRKRLSP
ncbi:helix-turn-helix domain-containing protein [Paenibacillus allorhizosphaerae]|uniref:HTH-type transcriptional activator RhaR n=1 Tax=Paenibacillus allorhizosphaerae TaxID=2849866 RepID=A0ABM8VBB6_9BACL|nr:helix-turn-helix domain-containing protein [Paenibacillus allorhizosphaerae]CAG7619099.1 HTH-type transcriptional activator RhaR [Paenibacillus allorhizosphaerae]